MDRTLEELAPAAQTSPEEIDPSHSLEHAMHQAEWFVAKVRDSQIYAQNVYAALCNNEFQEQDTWEILRDKTWSCTWRYAGGIVADIRKDGDYLDWYCSGMAGGDEPSVYMEARDLKRKNFVSEGVITDEVRTDLARLGWIPVVDQ